MTEPQNPTVVLYSSPMCGYCAAAKRLLRQKGVEFEEINVLFDRAKREEMIQKSAGRATVPQIFIADNHVGGCDDLYALDASGELDGLLKAAGSNNDQLVEKTEDDG